VQARTKPYRTRILCPSFPYVAITHTAAVAIDITPWLMPLILVVKAIVISSHQLIDRVS
jgi:hypothetical protein